MVDTTLLIPGRRVAGLALAIAFGGVSGLATGCAPARAPAFDAAYCAPPARSAHSSWVEDAPPVPSPTDSAETTRRNRIAALLGLHALTADAKDEGSARLLVLERIEAARSDIAASSAEIDCEGERAQQIGDAMADREASTTRDLTVASLVAASLTGIASGILMAENASSGSQAAVGISGAAVTGGLGFAALVVHSSIDFHHERNLLADVWQGPRVSTLYPPVVWAYLSRPEFSNDGLSPIRSKIVKRWRAFGDLDDERAKLLFGTGGTYHADTLHARSAMLDQVKAEVELLNQELAVLTMP